MYAYIRKSDGILSFYSEEPIKVDTSIFSRKKVEWTKEEKQELNDTLQRGGRVKMNGSKMEHMLPESEVRKKLFLNRLANVKDFDELKELIRDII